MRDRSFQLLRVFALIMGWLLMAGVLAGVGGRVAIYYLVQNNPMGSFDIVSALDNFFFGFGGAFLAFLIAAVVRMIERHAPVEHEYARRLMIVCCLSYAADALVRFWSLIRGVSAVSQMRIPWSVWNLIPLSSEMIPVAASILYAASIFVLYRHFAKMVMFESEVA